MARPKPPTPTPAARAAPLLDLHALTVRPIVRIQDVDYDMRTPDEVSVLEQHRLVTLGQRVEALEALSDPSDADQAEYERSLTSICQRVLLAPPEVIERLTIPQRAAVALSFSRLWLMASLQTTRAIVEAAKTHQAQTIGGCSFPGSNTPTGAPQ